MTKIERVMAAIQGEPVDKIPKGEFFLEEGLIKRLAELVNSEVPQDIGLKDKIEACQWLGLDIQVFAPDKNNSDQWQDLRLWRQETDMFLFAIIDGPFQGIYHQYADFTDFLMDTMRDPDKLKVRAEEIVCKSKGQALKAIEAGANGIIIGDDIAYNQGPYISPKTMREIFFPYLKELVQYVGSGADGEQKRPVFFHSDGNLLKLLEDIRDMGFDGIHSLEPVMDIQEVREIVGEDICLMGGFDLSWFLEDGLDKAKELLSKALPGRYIFGSTAGILDSSLPADKVLEVYRYVENNSKLK